MATIEHVSPLAPKAFPELPEVAGVSYAAVAAGVKYQGRKDVTLIKLDPGSTVAGVFTRSKTCSAAVLDCQAKIGGTSESGAAILINSGNANAFTGRNGQASVDAICAAVANELSLPPEAVFTSSTGVIGEPLPHEKIISVLKDAKRSLSPASVKDAAEGIMTTDTFAKGASARFDVDGTAVTITGIAKGSGMIAPDMATMLVYIFTDAKVEQSLLQTMVSELTDKTFNCITVDSDTSTSDTLLVGATGASGAEIRTKDGPFRAALHDVMKELSHLVIRDGEGATKFLEITVTGATTDTDAKTHAMAIANSPLVKTAVAGEDPNWGRIVMAIGKSGAAADRDLLTIKFGDILVAEQGWVAPAYSEAAGAAYMKSENLSISVDLGLGQGTATVWTCDLTHGYITINADYRS